VSDADDDHSATLRERDRQLTESQWNLHAAGYHFMTQWAAVEFQGPDLQSRESIEEWADRRMVASQAFAAEHGEPPGPFHTPRPGAPAVALPAISRSDGLYGVLARRRTTRAFAQDVPMRLEDLATVLRYVFGTHGLAVTRLGECIRRTSPSGGARHPVEVYPLIAHVEGIHPGFYHYDGQRHALTPISALGAAEVRSLATSFMTGQSYFGAAHVCFVLTARFSRSFWKYRGHDKGYAAILMDAAHLSQTLYLVATELGLGAFVTLAVNSRDIEARLDLDGYREGVVAMTGCGPRSAEASPLEPRFVPHPAVA
jgi:putative peptide maturation dehydrogenase